MISRLYEVWRDLDRERYGCLRMGDTNSRYDVGMLDAVPYYAVPWHLMVCYSMSYYAMLWHSMVRHRCYVWDAGSRYDVGRLVT